MEKYDYMKAQTDHQKHCYPIMPPRSLNSCCMTMSSFSSTTPLYSSNSIQSTDVTTYMNPTKYDCPLEWVTNNKKHSIIIQFLNHTEKRRVSTNATESHELSAPRIMVGPSDTNGMNKSRATTWIKA